MRAGNISVFTFARTVTLLSTCVSAALELLTTRQTAASPLEPARPVLHPLLAADARLLYQERTLGTVDIVRMAVVLHRGVSAGRCSSAVEAALRGPGSARLRGLQDSPAAGTADLLEDGFEAAWAGPSMANLRTLVSSTLQCPAAYAEADVFRLNLIRSLLLSMLPPSSLSLHCLLLPCTAALSTLVATAVELGLADLETHRSRDLSLMAEGLAHSTGASTGNILLLEACVTRTGMTRIHAPVTARKNLVADLLAVRNLVLTRLSWLVEELFQRCFATRTVKDNIWSRWAVCRHFVLRMASLLTIVQTTIVFPPTSRSAVE